MNTVVLASVPHPALLWPEPVSKMGFFRQLVSDNFAFTTFAFYNLSREVAIPIKTRNLQTVAGYQPACIPKMEPLRLQAH